MLAFVALLAALSGTAVALPGKSTVDSGDIKNKQVKRADLSNNAVNSSKVQNGSLLSGDFKSGQLPAGPKGDKGATGATGPSNAYHAFADGPANILQSQAGTTFFPVLILIGLPAGAYVVTANVTVSNDDLAAQTVDCQLQVGTKATHALIGLSAASVSGKDSGSASLQIATTLTAPSGAVIQCTNPGGDPSDTDIHDRHITAIRVGSLTGGEPQP